MEDLLMPFRFAFMQKAFLIAAIVCVPTALLSCFLVLKGWALMGDAVSHAVLPGIVLAYVLGFPLIVGAFAAGMFTAVATGYLAENSRVKRDTVMGVVFSGMFGLGIVTYVALRTNVHLDHILFGNVLGVNTADLWSAGAIATFVTVVLLLKWKDLLLHAFDPSQARAVGLPVSLLHYGLLALLSLTIVATLSATGLILAIALLIGPGAVAFLSTRTFPRMMAVSVAVCAFSTLGGVYLSFFLDSSPAATIVLLLTAVFILAYLRKTAQLRRASLAALRTTGP